VASVAMDTEIKLLLEYSPINSIAPLSGSECLLRRVLSSLNAIL
jgi:hypothetical protein